MLLSTQEALFLQEEIDKDKKVAITKKLSSLRFIVFSIKLYITPSSGTISVTKCDSDRVPDANEL